MSKSGVSGGVDGCDINLMDSDSTYASMCLTTLTTLVALAKSKAILQHVDDKKADLLARDLGFDYVEGSYYRAIPFDYSNKSGTPVKMPIKISF